MKQLHQGVAILLALLCLCAVAGHIPSEVLVYVGMFSGFALGALLSKERA